MSAAWLDDPVFSALAASPVTLASTVFDTLHQTFQYLPDHIYLMEVYAQYDQLVQADPTQEADIQMALYIALPPERAAAVLAYGNRSDLRGDLCASTATPPDTILI